MSQQPPNETRNDTFSILLIPWEELKPIQTIDIAFPGKSKSDDSSTKFGNAGNLAGAFAGGKDQIIQHLYSFIDENTVQIEATPLKRMSPIMSKESSHYTEEELFHASGIYAYHCVNSDTNPAFANIRATRLSMACGLLSQRFYGDVFVARLGYFHHFEDGCDEVIYMMKNRSVSLDEIKYATYVTPDLRKNIIQMMIPKKVEEDDGEDEGEGEGKEEGDNHHHNEDEIIIPLWLADAAKSNYEDAAALDILASTLNKQTKQEFVDEDGNSDDEDGSEDGDEGNNGGMTNKTQKMKKQTLTTPASKSVVVRTPLCIHCRRPSKNLCPDCEGVYFYEPECVEQG